MRTKWVNNYKFMVLDYILCFEAPGLIAQFSKCDFWNLEKIWDRNNLCGRKFSRRKIFDRKKIDRK